MKVNLTYAKEPSSHVGIFYWVGGSGGAPVISILIIPIGAVVIVGIVNWLFLLRRNAK
jgi:hypothetical protein